ncbi:hypothetical protein CISG_10398 [Coccidioides immitis RMSCC 3703]|uniref:Uncharacterized protein n=2 Tax=Coccidioides immitis TaxID=5501 RepID=A0A0J8QWC9_COCIT|nr:hypothetical protein CIRG_04105 [Coccidioides immitis RMSCC 2394]KMU75628.1 hypothetical protein CISG_10398 [Coccidioides immitis RMSCC 3703]
MPKNNQFHLIAIHIQALALVSWGIPVNEVSTALGIPARTLQAIEKQAKDYDWKNVIWTDKTSVVLRH